MPGIFLQKGILLTTFDDMKISATRRMMFPTPIVQARIDQGGTFLDALKQCILARREADPTGITRSNAGGWHSSGDMMSWGGAEAAELVRRTIALARLVSNPEVNGRRFDELKFVIEMWANVSGYGASNHVHVHSRSIWSCVLYVDPGGDGPEGDDTEAYGGEFFFEDPRFPLISMYDPGYGFVGKDGKPQALFPQVRPKRGDILLFPSWLRHGVQPYLGKRERISIAINLGI